MSESDLYHFRRRERTPLVHTTAWAKLLEEMMPDPKRRQHVWAGHPIYFTFEPSSKLRGVLWSIGYEQYWWFKYRFTKHNSIREFRRDRDQAIFDVTHKVSDCINNELAAQIVDGTVNLVLDHPLDPEWEQKFFDKGFKVVRT